jgi:hypothetical protein
VQSVQIPKVEFEAFLNTHPDYADRKMEYKSDWKSLGTVAAQKEEYAAAAKKLKDFGVVPPEENKTTGGGSWASEFGQKKGPQSRAL